MASNYPDQSYCCEICGLDSLTEDELRIHTHTIHVDGNGSCPFCQLSAISPPELLLHVNQAHLDFLTPESEMNMSFIDDASPGYVTIEITRILYIFGSSICQICLKFDHLN